MNIIRRRSRKDQSVTLRLHEDEVLLVINALQDYAEWAEESSADKRWEAENSHQPFYAEGLDAEADHYEREGAAARRFVDEVLAGA